MQVIPWEREGEREREREGERSSESARKFQKEKEHYTKYFNKTTEFRFFFDEITQKHPVNSWSISEIAEFFLESMLCKLYAKKCKRGSSKSHNRLGSKRKNGKFFRQTIWLQNECDQYHQIDERHSKSNIHQDEISIRHGRLWCKDSMSLNEILLRECECSHAINQIYTRIEWDKSYQWIASNYAAENAHLWTSILASHAGSKRRWKLSAAFSTFMTAGF